jgi:hypothetical protein
MKTCWTKVDVCLAGEWPSTGAQHEQRKRILPPTHNTLH